MCPDFPRPVGWGKFNDYSDYASTGLGAFLRDLLNGSKNFTVDLPKRLAELDRQFRPIALSENLDVSYALMKLAAAFLLPYTAPTSLCGTCST